MQELKIVPDVGTHHSTLAPECVGRCIALLTLDSV